MLEAVSENNYLDITKVKFLGAQTSVAYLVSARPDLDRNKQPYVVFRFKDANGFDITGRWFNIDAETAGTELMRARNHPVEVTYVGSSFGNQLSLQVSGLKLYNGEFDHKLFLKALPNAETTLTQINKTVGDRTGIEVPFSPRYISSTYNDVANGITGGYVKLIHMVVMDMLSYSNIPAVDISDIMRVTVHTLNGYAKYLEYSAKTEINFKHEYLRLIESEISGIDDSRLRNICMDSFTATVGMGEAEHLYAKLVSEQIVRTIRNLDLCYMYPLVVNNSIMKIGDLKLAKY